MALKEKILDRAQKFIQKGAIDKAIIEYKAAFELDPKDTSIRLRMGDLYIKVGKKDVAIKEYTEAAKANTQRGFYLKAIAVYKQILKLDPTNLDVHNKLAELYTKQRLIADAVSEYSFIVTVFERNGKVNETIELLKKMVDIDPENIGVRLKLAELHHRRSFKNDALAEYAWIFDRLVSQGKLDKAEKIYLGLANSYPGEPEVFEKLAGLYKAGGNSNEFYKYASRLFEIYKSSGDAENAKAICQSILEVRPEDAASLGYLSKHRAKEGPVSAAPSFEMPAREPISREDTPKGVEDLPRTSEPVREAAPPPEVVKEEPEEEIEIALEGFEEEQEEAAKEEAAPAALKEEIIPEIKSGHAGAEVKAGTSGATAEQSDEEEVEFELGAGAVVSEPEEEAARKPVSEPPRSVSPPVQAEAAFNESEEKRDEEVLSAVPEGAEAEQEEYVLNETDQYVPENEDAGVSEAPSASAATEETEPVEIARAPDVLQMADEEAVIAEAEELETGPAAVEPPGVIQQEAQASEESIEPAVESEEVLEDISKAISELMEKIEPEGAGTDAYDQNGIIEEAEEIAEESEEKDEYVDLSAELGMEETVENLAESWGKGESRETFDEFKSGIGKQLNKEDSETHYNLGIAYMEMELYGEAVKEFKIALKDANLEFDCYTRLGLCYMSMSYPDDAILSYLKGLRARGRSDEERRGMMYELALAYESTGKKDLALQLFKSIYDIAPDYREVSKKVKVIAEEKERPFMPLDDGLIEVELL